jgi:hypothetical protein
MDNDYTPENLPVEQYEFIRRRVNRRVRGRLLFMAHRGWAVAMGVLAAIAIIAEMSSPYSYDPSPAGIFFTWFVLVGFPFGIHWAMRWLNRKAEVMRRQEMQQELAYEMARLKGQGASAAEKPKRTARLSDDGELEYADEELVLTQRKAK